jgi:hypothetical protein
VVFPNGIAPLSDQVTLTDATAVGQLKLKSGGYTYLLPMGLWILIAGLIVIGSTIILIVKAIRRCYQRRNERT